MVAFSEYVKDGTASTMKARDYKDATDLMACTNLIGAFKGGQGASAGGVGFDAATAPTLTAAESGSNRVPVITFDSRQDCVSSTEVFGALGSSSPQAQAVAFAQNTRDEVREMSYVGDLAAQPGMKQTSYTRSGMAVRRLTPTECERLQGFLDGYTLIPVGKKMAADGPRYKALGNSMAVPVMAWIGDRIAQVEQISAAKVDA